MPILITGAAGFIGSHVAGALLARGEAVIGIDNFSDYYDPGLKYARLAALQKDARFAFVRADITDRESMFALAGRHADLTGIVHLAAQPGVFHSMVDPYIYVQTNVMGHLVMLEVARKCPALRHFVYASSSSVYGRNHKLPFSIADRVDRPASLYAATKRADELMTDAYVHQYGFNATGVRYFTVYGPWGRPDMSPYIFAKAILEGRTIALNHLGRIRRGYSYIDDIVAGTLAILDRPTDEPSHRIYNLGASESENIGHVLSLFEKALGRRARIELRPGEPGDMPETVADIDDTVRTFDWTPKVPIEQGIPLFVDWFRKYKTGISAVLSSTGSTVPKPAAGLVG
ncbi:NAD-dependent epimerase/dehydratase family protein [Reyranella sp.]|jgi:UDP-glucuronate 4-epimerase|uniref:NAD-dependent epimerase/dehydratase family protein n=1 Tax=Reyranella sp. TaxID=1929291 RepID=UPI002F939A0F